MAYIPPHLRDQGREQSSSTAGPSAGHAPESLTRYAQYDASGLSVEDIQEHFGTGVVHATLNASGAVSTKVSYILLSRDANPRWKDEQIIFTETHIDLLPGFTDQVANLGSRSLEDQVTDSEWPNDDALQGSSNAPNGAKETARPATTEPSSQKPSDPKPLTDIIAVFEQHHALNRGRGFKFAGWYGIMRVAFLEPYSAELGRMLEQKWQRTMKNGRIRQVERDPEGWRDSMKRRWAVVKLARDEAADKEKGEPAIQTVGRAGGDGRKQSDAGKSVNELLAESRREEDGV